MTLSNVDASSAGLYSVVVSNAFGAVASSPASLSISNVPDLFPVSLQVPTTITSTVPNPTIQVVLAVTNQGNGSAVGCWYDRLYLSTNANLTSSIASWAWYTCWNLATNASYKLTNNVALSLSQNGTYYLLFRTDDDNRLYESNENNNVSSAVPVVFSLTQPDLMVSSISVPTTAQIPGPLQVVYAITNSGIAVASGPWQNQFLLATNASGGGAQSLGSAVFNGSIPSGGSVTVTQDVALAANSLGTRFIGVFVDSANNVLESNEANNTAFASTSTEIMAPDLAATRVAAPLSAVIAQPVPVVFTITNQGNAVAAGP
jgi:subtilase family serine protease